jgi:hypothetical protein
LRGQRGKRLGCIQWQERSKVLSVSESDPFSGKSSIFLVVATK